MHAKGHLQAPTILPAAGLPSLLRLLLRCAGSCSSPLDSCIEQVSQLLLLAVPQQRSPALCCSALRSPRI